MTMAQMRLFLREGGRIKRKERAAFITDIRLAAFGEQGDLRDMLEALKG